MEKYPVEMQNQLQLKQLSSDYMPLIKKFYKQHYNSTKPKSDDLTFGLYQQHQLLGIVRYKPVDQAFLLTGLAVHSEHREQGLARFILQRSLTKLDQQACYCFSLPHLTKLYRSVGFAQIAETALPNDLKNLFHRYTRNSKRLVAMALER